VHTNQKPFHLHASATQMQWYSRAIVWEELVQGPYTIHSNCLEPLLYTLQAERSNREATVWHMVVYFRKETKLY